MDGIIFVSVSSPLPLFLCLSLPLTPIYLYLYFHPSTPTTHDDVDSHHSSGTYLPTYPIKSVNLPNLPRSPSPYHVRL
ncbi:hypothetical protein F5X96DRAFT_663060, partial [Biscogniauxia mediterranea]